MAASVNAVVLAIYMIVMIAIAFYAMKKTKTVEDFVVAARNLPLWLAFFSLAATWICGGTTLGVAGSAYREGVTSVAVPWGEGMSLILVGLLFSRQLRRLNLLTMSDYFLVRFGSRPYAALSAALMTLAYSLVVGAQFVAAGKMCHVVFGWDQTLSIVMAAVVLVAYTYMGGLWADVYTDLIQVSITFVGILLAVPMAVSAVGGWGTLVARTPVEFWDWGGLLRFGPVTLFLICAFGGLAVPDLIERSLASRDEKVAVHSAWPAGIVYFAVGFSSAIIGMAASILIPGLEDTELAYPMMLTSVLPPFVGVVVMMGLYAALMSTADSMILAPATLVAKNIFKDLFRPSASGPDLLRWCRYTVLIMGAIGLSVAVLYPGALYWLVMGWDVLFASLAVPLAASLYWGRCNLAGALSSTLVGMAARIILQFVVSEDNWYYASFGAPALSLVVLVVVTLATSPPTQSQMEAYKKARTPTMRVFPWDRPAPTGESAAASVGLAPEDRNSARLAFYEQHLAPWKTNLDQRWLLAWEQRKG